ncbi:MAG: hypothetical protein PHI85_02850 [Victivallaceae bacterium]|nr:hypothetical protein [Victivallaceae bacterium]
MMTARFKRDYVAFMAVFLFFLIVCCEVAVAVWIPLQMRNEALFANEMRRIRTLRQFDAIRLSLIRRIPKNNPLAANEAAMLLEQMNALAIYLNADNRRMTLQPEYVDMLADELSSVSRHSTRLVSGRSVSQPLSLDTSKYIKSLADEKKAAGEGGK